MFGRNIPIKPDKGDGSSLRVVGIWPTIQGEGPFTGMPAIFVRLAGCNLSCHFCDTDFESKAMTMTVDEIVVAILHAKVKCPARLIVLTGGEPMAQNIVPLIRKLTVQVDADIQIETAGTVWPDEMDSVVGVVAFVCSPKTPVVHSKIKQFCRHWKYILRADELDPDDGLPVMSTQEEGRPSRLFRPPPHMLTQTIWVQPCEEYTKGVDNFLHDASIPDHFGTHRNLKLCVEVAMNHGYRISLQTHKLMGVE